MSGRGKGGGVVGFVVWIWITGFFATINFRTILSEIIELSYKKTLGIELVLKEYIYSGATYNKIRQYDSGPCKVYSAT